MNSGRILISGENSVGSGEESRLTSRGDQKSLRDCVSVPREQVGWVPEAQSRGVSGSVVPGRAGLVPEESLEKTALP